ncbi:MAG: glycosyltransferase family 2 protein [Prevotellaceae bacterium]|jgi:GT2 family glycosyltransferase|nr:glycosyltransferase family 2 protein [Prevotellaceae bacterium]
MENPVLSIVTVGMNHYKYIKDLYRSLYKENRPLISFETVYVDNCSSDESVNHIRENYPQTVIIQNKTIKGFGENNNLGVSVSKGKYIAIINPDIVVLPKSIDVLYEYMIENPATGILAPQLLNPDCSIQYSVRRFITLKTFVYRLISRGKDTSKNKIVGHYLQKDIDNGKTQTVDWAIGAAMFIDREFFIHLNGFDEDYFLYLEDEDICLRSWKNGKPVIYLPDAKMIHNHIRESSKTGKKTIHHIKSLITFFRKHGYCVHRSLLLNNYNKTDNPEMKS